MIRLRRRLIRGVGGGRYKSHYITIPSEIIRALGWRENDLLDIKIVPVNKGSGTSLALLIYRID